MTVGLMGRPKKDARQRNYKISNDLLVKLKAIAQLEDRSETAQLERAIREMAERREEEYQTRPEYQAKYRELVSQYSQDLEEQGR